MRKCICCFLLISRYAKAWHANTQSALLSISTSSYSSIRIDSCRSLGTGNDSSPLRAQMARHWSTCIFEVCLTDISLSFDFLHILPIRWNALASLGRQIGPEHAREVAAAVVLCTQLNHIRITSKFHSPIFVFILKTLCPWIHFFFFALNCAISYIRRYLWIIGLEHLRILYSSR